MLSGHTHGGQIRIPFSGKTFYSAVKDERFVSGLNRCGNNWIYTTPGIGSNPGVRFACPPEVSVLELTGVRPRSGLGHA